MAGTAVSTWFFERMRDLSMWPVNLVRDFPLRVRRLGRLLLNGARGAIEFLPGTVRAARRDELGRWLRCCGGRLAAWFHQLLMALFDLVGGPELAQFLTHWFTITTPLTREEIGMISSVLGPEALRYEDVRVAEGGLLDVVFRLNGNLAFATWHTVNLPRNGRHTRQNYPILIHELTHVYQYEQVGSRYLGEAAYMLIKTKRDCYNYGGRSGLVDACAVGLRYCDYNREQQAQITQDYFFLRQKGADVTAYEPFIAQARAGEL